MYDKTDYNNKKKETKSTYVNKDTIQTFNWHKLQKELYIFHEKKQQYYLFLAFIKLGY